MKNSLCIHKWTHNEFNIFILGVLTHPHYYFTNTLICVIFYIVSYKEMVSLNKILYLCQAIRYLSVFKLQH